MHIHCRFLPLLVAGAILAQDLPTGLLQAQTVTATRWVISALHPDPTPALGAPDCEYIALHALPDSQPGGGTCRTDGLVLSWNGHERELPDGAWPVGSTVVVHRAADSLLLTDWALHRIGLSSWPALVNGGTLVSLSDSGGALVDAVLYDEEALAGGGRPLLRQDPRACGAGVNFAAWTAPSNPFDPVGIPPNVEGLVWTSDALLSESEAFDRMLVRGPGHLEWRLPGPVDPRAMVLAEWRVGGVRLPTPLWSSDSVVTVTWTDRLEGSPAPHTDEGLPMRLGPVRGCAPGSAPVFLKGRWTALPAAGEVGVVGMLADPLPDDPLESSESVRLLNLADRVLDAGGWRWGGARLMRRALLLPDQPRTFREDDFEDWPGLANAGGWMQVTTPQGQPVVSWSWSPCSHTLEELEGRALPLERVPATGQDWHTKGHPETESTPEVTGYGCPRDWSGEVQGVEVHFSVPALFLDGTEWRWVTSDGDEEPMDGEVILESPNTIRLTRRNGAPLSSDWPSSSTVKGWNPALHGGSGTAMQKGWHVSVSCPPVPLPDRVELRVNEALWAAEDGGGEFVEVENRSGFPVDVGGLQVTKETHPDPSNWQVWVEGGRSLVVPTGGVMAFGRCPRWFRRGHPEAGPACWPAESWFSLSDEAGSLSLRLPSHGPEPIDSISWHAGMQGPWWWQETGWAWRRMGPGPEDWSPSTDGGSPGAINRAEPVDCPGQDAPVSVVVGVNGLPALRWRFPSAGHSVLLRMVRWPDGTLVNTQGLDLSERQGEWTWTGEDSSGNPVPPGGLVWDVRWWGRTCRGRFREHLRVPGRP